LKSHSYKFLFLFILFALVGCGSLEKTNQSGATKASEETETTENQEVENQESEDANNSFQVLETVKDFGGGTFDINNELESASDIYLTESNDEIFMNFYNRNLMVVSGNKDGWQSISNENENNFGDDSGYFGATKRYVRGNTLYEEKDDTLTIKKLTFDDVNTSTKMNEPIAINGKLILVNTSKGEGVIIISEDNNRLYIDGEMILEFQDGKNIIDKVSSQTQFPHEAKNYVDIENKKFFFVDDYDEYVHVLDLETGETVFEDGELKGIKLSDKADIIGDDKGNIYIFQVNGDNLLLGLFNSNLDFISEFTITVENPDDFSVTKTEDELHIWSKYDYEMEQMLELTKISRPTF